MTTSANSLSDNFSAAQHGKPLATNLQHLYPCHPSGKLSQTIT
jgi:hypothetical protein